MKQRTATRDGTNCATSTQGLASVFIRQREENGIRGLTFMIKESKILSMEDAIRLHADWLTAPDGAMWPRAFIEWAYKNGFKLTEVKDGRQV